MTKNLYKQLLEKPTETVRRFLNYNHYMYHNQKYTFFSMLKSTLFDKYEVNCLTAMKVLDKRKLEGTLTKE
jgi:hypothetical protein